MRRLDALLLIAALAAGACSGAVVAAQPLAAAPNTFSVLSYHEVRDDVRNYPDPYAVDAAALVQQFAWLRENGYVPVSVAQILASRQGGTPLPAKAVLLSFDDGYLSFYTRVYPLLREFRFPAVLAVVGRWVDNPAGTPAVYGEKSSVPEASFPSWVQLREMADSGWVEIASHAYDLHQGVLANPQGNLQPAATARVYDAASGAYESDAVWRDRVRADLARNVQMIERGTGQKPRAMVWPYGSYNDELVRMAEEMGMPVAITLEDGANTPDIPLNRLRRTLIQHDPALADFITELRGPLFPEPVRVVQLSLDVVYSADPALQENNLSLLLERIKVLRPTHVYLQATADVDGDGIADAAYFPTGQLPLRADLFNRVAWQLASRDDTKVFAVLPVAAYRLRQDQVAELYQDLARHAQFDGLLFMQDAPQPAGDVAPFIALTQRLAEGARQWRALKIARGISAGSASAQAVSALAASSDYVVIAVTPGQPGLSASGALPSPDWRGQAMPEPHRPSKLVMLMSRPAVSDPSAGAQMAQQMRRYQLEGMLNFGYSGDDFSRDQPPLVQIAPAMSLRVDPR